MVTLTVIACVICNFNDSMRCGDEETGLCRNSLTRLRSPSWELGEPVCEARLQKGKCLFHRLPLPGATPPLKVHLGG